MSPVTLVSSRWSSGELIFHEKTGLSTLYDVLKLGTGAVTIGSATNDVDFKYYGTSSISAIIDCGGSSFTLVGINMATDEPIVITDDTASTSTTTGALIVTGGVGIAKGLFVGEVVSVGTVRQPDASDGAALGTTSLMWMDLFLASGGVINFNAGDVTITHSTNDIAIAGGTTTFGGNLILSTNTDLTFTGTTGTNEVTLVTNLADALSIGDGADLIVFATTTGSQLVTITPATTITGALTCAEAGGVATAKSFKISDGGTVTQITSATTGVTLNTSTGQITTYAQNIAAAGEVEFTVTNSVVAATSLIIVAVASGSTGGTTIAEATAIGTGSFKICLTNLHAATAETGTLVINFAVLTGSAT